MLDHEIRGIRDVVQNSRLVEPNPEKVRETHLGSVEAFQELLKRSWENPLVFWEEVARELHWFQPWKETMTGDFPEFQFFTGGISNPCYNLLDRHIKSGAGNKAALIWEGENGETRFYTYNMLLAEVNRFANVLKGFGVKKGDPVAIFLPNLPEAVISVLACFRLGAVYNTIFSGFSTESLKDRLIHFEPKLIVTADAALRRGKTIPLKDKVDQIIPSIKGVEAIVVVNRLEHGVHMREGRDFWWHHLMRDAGIQCEPVPVEANEPGIVFYTSGTTGNPKGVVHSGMAFVVQNYIYAKYHMDHHQDDTFWCTADIGWLTMHIWGIVGALANGVTTVVYEGAPNYPEPDRFYQIIERYRVNKLFTAPTALRMLKSLGKKALKPYDLSCLDVIALVGEPFDPETWHWTREVLGNNKVYVNNTWGQTEVAGCPIAGAAWLTPMKPGSAGIQFLGASMDVVDDNGHSVPAGVLGNLVMRKPIPMLCRTLWKQPDRYKKAYFSQVEGCYFASDIALKDEDGHFWVVGRSDDAFNVAGHRLSTMEMESAVMECDGISEAAVIGIPDEIKGEIPVVFAKTTERVPADEEELRRKISQRIVEKIGEIARPGTVYFLDEMPKTISGKIMRRLLKEMVVKGEVTGDVTGLEDPHVIDNVSKSIKKAKGNV
ncbi:acetate--CoA ligase [Laceyella putida]|uniref:acetate--CoA ligase n=1 Tax=Laceyella putida TaxID=110101 RepID=A0ABW2RH40_9BACL